MQGNIVRQLIGGVSEKIAPSDVSNLTIKVGNGKLTVFWKDPNDTVVDGQTVCTWKGTKLVQKAGSYPENLTDGILVLDNQERNKYATNGFEINGLTNGTTYYFSLFPYSTENAVNVNVENRISGIPIPYRIMTATIDLSNSNPATCISYEDDAVEMIAKSNAWDDFFGHYPCLFKNGVEVGKLNKNNFDQFENGTSADITSGNAGDVMIAFPRRGLNISTVGNKVKISMTDNPNDSNFKYYAHSKGEIRKEIFYKGAFKGFKDSSDKLRSLSGKTPITNLTISKFRNYANMNGIGYEQSGFYQLVFNQAMYILKYKNLNSQKALGSGYVKGSSNSTAINTGGTNTKGMDFGETTGLQQMKIFGLEDFWGNLYEWIDGLIYNSSRHILTGTYGFNNTGSGYTDQGEGASSDLNGYMSTPQGSSETGFIVKQAYGSASMYFSDNGSLRSTTSGSVPSFGGSPTIGLNGGAFHLCVDYLPSIVGGSNVGRTFDVFIINFFKKIL